MSSQVTPRVSGLTARIAAMLLLVAMPALAGTFAHADLPRESEPITWGIAPADGTDADGRGAIAHILEPGQSLVEHVLVRNLGAQPLTLDLYTADATLDDGGVFDLLTDDEESSGVGAWATTKADEITLGPRERRVVPVTIEVPATAEPGDHAGGVVAVLPASEFHDQLPSN